MNCQLPPPITLKLFDIQRNWFLTYMTKSRKMTKDLEFETEALITRWQPSNWYHWIWEVGWNIGPDDANSNEKVTFDEFKAAMQRDSSFQDVVLSFLRPIFSLLQVNFLCLLFWTFRGNRRSMIKKLKINGTYAANN